MCSTISDGLEVDILIDGLDWVAKSRLVVVRKWEGLMAAEERGNDKKWMLPQPNFTVPPSIFLSSSQV